MTVIGLVTLGQTPRPDHVNNFRQYVGEADIRIIGALDGLSGDEIDMLSQPGEYPLLVKLSDNTTVTIPLKKLVPFIEKKANELARDGAHFIIILCAGAFPDITCPVPVLIPGKILPAVLGTISSTRRIGIVSPVEGQVSAAQSKWEQDGFTVKVTWASPYNENEVNKAAEEMNDPGLEFVLLDCMGHNEGHRKEFAQLCGRPVLLTQTLIARIAGEFAESFTGTE